MIEKIELEPEEKILATVRKHWFIIFSQLIGTGFMIFVPLFIILFLSLAEKSSGVLTILQNNLQLGSFVLIFWVLLSLLSGFMIWTSYYLDLWLITDHRIIVVNQINFFNRTVSNFRLERLQDVNVVVNGLIPTFLNFGTIHAHTAGNNEEKFATSGLPDPRELQAIIQKATDARLRDLSRLTYTAE